MKMRDRADQTDERQSQHLGPSHVRGRTEDPEASPYDAGPRQPSENGDREASVFTDEKQRNDEIGLSGETGQSEEQDRQPITSVLSCDQSEANGGDERGPAAPDDRSDRGDSGEGEPPR